MIQRSPEQHLAARGAIIEHFDPEPDAGPTEAPPETSGRSNQPRVQLIRFDEIRLGNERRYLVKGLIPRTGLTIIWGAPKSGKSFISFDITMHVAMGWEYRGRRVHQGPVVYCAFEGQSGIEARVEAFRNEKLASHVENVPFFLEPLTLDLVRDHQELIEVVRRQVDGGPVLVVLDTLNRSLRGSESSDEDMSAYVKAADAIREAFDCAVVIVHHCGVDGNRPRGHTSLTGAADAQLQVKMDASGRVIAEVEFMKDGPAGETFASRLEVVDVGTDEDGDPITSCIVVETETSKTATATTRLTKNQQTMYDILLDAGPSGLSWKEWQDQTKAAGIGVRRKADLFDTRRALKNKRLVREGTNGWFVERTA